MHRALLLPAGVPYSDVNLRTHKASSPVWTKQSSLSEVTSLNLEFSFLAQAAASSTPLAGCGVQELRVLSAPSSRDWQQCKAA